MLPGAIIYKCCAHAVASFSGSKGDGEQSSDIPIYSVKLLEVVRRTVVDRACTEGERYHQLIILKIDCSCYYPLPYLILMSRH